MSKTRYNWKNLSKLWDKYRSVSAIARHIGCSEPGVRRQLKNREIGPYSKADTNTKKKKKKRKKQKRERQEEKREHSRIPWYLKHEIPYKFDKDRINQQYDEFEGDVAPIAKELKCSRFAVVKLMRREKLGPFRK